MKKKNEKDKAIEEILNKDIKNIGLSNKACRALKSAGFNNVIDLIAKIQNKNQLSNIRGIGEVIASQIIDRIHSLGLSFQYESIPLIEEESKKIRKEREPLTLEESAKMEEADFLLKNLIEFFIRNYKRLNKVLEEYQSLSEKLLQQIEMKAIEEGYSNNKVEFIKTVIEEKSESPEELKILQEALANELNRQLQQKKEKGNLQREYRKMVKNIKDTKAEIIELHIDRMKADGTIENEK